jgi:DNA-binding transcriptional LysR family regulator
MSVLIEFRHLKYILAVAETGNFTRAAERLFLAQPSLSAQIKDLEDTLGFPIFLRDRTGVYCTPAGEMIVSYAESALAEQTETVKAARAIYRGEIPILRLGFSCFVQPELLQSFRDAYARLFPDCQMQLSSGNHSHILHRLEEKSLDGALLPMPITGDDWVFEQIACSPLVVCMRTDDPLAEEIEIQPAELPERSTIFRDPEMHPAAHARLMNMLSEVKILPKVSSLAATPADIQFMVQAGCGLALMDQRTVLYPGLTGRPIAGIRWTVDTAFVHHNNAEHLALPILVRYLRKLGNGKPLKRPARRKHVKGLQLELLA